MNTKPEALGTWRGTAMDLMVKGTTISLMGAAFIVMVSTAIGNPFMVETVPRFD